MFAVTQLGAMSMGIPDVCKVPVLGVPVPTPFPNIAMSTTHVPNVENVLIAGGPAHNLMTAGTISNGDEAGAEGGLLSSLIIGPDTYVLGSMSVIWGTAPGARLTSVTGHNGKPFNAPGIVMLPSQPTVMLLG